jgi:hypothetical protein
LQVLGCALTRCCACARYRGGVGGGSRGGSRSFRVNRRVGHDYLVEGGPRGIALHL